MHYELSSVIYEKWLVSSQSIKLSIEWLLHPLTLFIIKFHANRFKKTQNVVFLPFVSAIALMYSLMSTLNWFSAESSSTLRVEQTWYQRLNWNRPSNLVPAHSSLKYLYLQMDNLNAVLYKYCNKHALSLTHTIILNVCLTTCMHGLYTSTQHLDETLEPLNWIRVCPSRRDEHSRKRSHVLYYVSCNIIKYTTFKPHTCPSFCIFIPNNGSHLINIKFSL